MDQEISTEMKKEIKQMLKEAELEILEEQNKNNELKKLYKKEAQNYISLINKKIDQFEEETEIESAIHNDLLEQLVNGVKQGNKDEVEMIVNKMKGR